MNENLTHIIFLIDRSGSMSIIKESVLSGFNNLIREQKKINVGETKLSLYQFDTFFQCDYEMVDISDVSILTEDGFSPRGGTALYSSLGKLIADYGKKLSSLEESKRPKRVLVVTITDGENNSVLLEEKKQYTQQEVFDMIKHQQEKYSWEFAYIGANQDSWKVGNGLSIDGSKTLNYTANHSGSIAMFHTLNDSVTNYRCVASSSFKLS